MIEFVEIPNSDLGGWAPCPYARVARINDKIEIVFCEVKDFMDTVRDSCAVLESKDIAVICFDHNNIDPVTLQEWVSASNKTLMANNYVILEDHPGAPEYTNGVRMNFGHCGIMILQKLDKLNIAADQLRSKGYYDVWNSQQLNSVVTWRYQ
jgi:hypothetical protein